MENSYAVLVVEDDPLFRMTVTAYLEDSGFAIMEAADGIEGIAMFEASRPDVVLTDLRMPKTDGLGLIAAIKRQSPDTPVIVFTGTNDPSAADNVLRLGASACLFKPIENLQYLEEAIWRALGKDEHLANKGRGNEPTG